MSQFERELHAEEVADYLYHNREFFHVFPELLNELSVPHPKLGGEISLLERQVWNLRQQKEALQQQIEALTEVAGENGVLLQKVQQFGLALMRTQDETEAVAEVVRQMKEVFGVPFVALFSWEVPSCQVEGLHQLGLSQAWLKALKETLQPEHPVCGGLEDHWRKGLFPQVETEVRSTCLLPLGRERVWGVLALGSDEETRFHAEQGTYFLTLMGQMVSAKLASLFGE